MILAWRWRFVIPYALIVLALSTWVVIRTRRGPAPEEWWHALTVYVAAPFGLPWSMLLPGGWWIYGGLVLNAGALFGLGRLVELFSGRPA